MRAADVVVVGAGSAGCVMARRLADAGITVTLVEAGPLDPPPSIASESFFDAIATPGWTWSGLDAERVPGRGRRPYARGRGAGGSSAVNAMLVVIGEPDDYDAWERDHGCDGWTWREVGPIFASLAIPRREVAPARLAAVVGAAWEQSGRPGRLEAARLTQWSDGRRASAFDVYVEPARDRIVVRGDTEVDHLAIEGGRVTGVVTRDGEFLGSKLVVVAGGAVRSPVLLQRSGLDNPAIGRGLQDHPSAPFTLVWRDPSDPALAAVTGFVRTTSGAVPNDLQILPIEHLGRDAPGLATVSAALMNVWSRGSIVGDDIRFGMLTDERDVEALTKGVSALRDVLSAPAIDRLVSGVFVDDAGTPLSDLDDDAIPEWLMTRTGDYVHAAGGCCLGPRDRAVVDPLGRSWDIDGLFVADASVIPRLPRANTHLTAMMIAEKISRSVIADLAA